MTKAFDKIMAGLDDARAYLHGDHAGFAVHAIEVSCPDVVESVVLLKSSSVPAEKRAQLLVSASHKKRDQYIEACFPAHLASKHLESAESALG